MSRALALSTPRSPVVPALTALALAALLGLVATGAEAAEPFTAKDLWSMDRVMDPRPAADGSGVVFVVRSTDFEADRGRTDLWWVGAEGGEPRRLTEDDGADVSPRWAGDGSSLYFLSSRSGSMQVWRLPFGAGGFGEAVQVTDLPLGVESFAVSPTGGRLAVSLRVFPDCDTLQCTLDRQKAAEDSPENARIYDRLMVRHWDSWLDGRRSHLFTVSLGGDLPVTTAVDVTAGLDADVPSRPFGGDEEYTFTPDGAELVYTAKVAPEGGTGKDDPAIFDALSTDYDLYRVPADGSGPARVLTDANRAWDTQPTFSPDGKTLAWLAMERPGFEADRLVVQTMAWPPAEGASPRALTDGWDRSVGSLAWSADGGSLLVTAGDTGRGSLFAVDLTTGEPRRLVAGGYVSSPAPLGEDRIVVGLDSFTSPVELHTVPFAGGEPTALTDINGERLAEIAMGDYEQFSFAGWNGETVHGYVVEPAEMEEGKRYPVAFLIHGGPQGSFSDHFHYRWNPQAYAGAGYAAVIVDFHGSTGYGQAFTDSITGDWGGKPLEDLQKGLAAALERYDFLDGDRVCALGASYGGYMINWIAGAWPERFRCLVNHDGIFDMRMMYYTTEELWFPEWEHGGPYFASPGHEEANPASLVTKWQTPMLVIHGSLDFRIPDTQALAAFTALQRRGVPSRLLIFPEENHWVLSPANGLLWHETVLGWMDRWLRQDGSEELEPEAGVH